MPEYRIAPDQGVCPEGHPCQLDPARPTSRVCASPHVWTDARSRVYTGAALVDVYIGPIGVETFQHAQLSLYDLMRRHEGDHNCPGVEVCEGWFAGSLRAIRDALGPLEGAQP